MLGQLMPVHLLHCCDKAHLLMEDAVYIKSHTLRGKALCNCTLGLAALHLSAKLYPPSAIPHSLHQITDPCVQEFLCMLQLHGIPVPSTALPRVPRDSSSLYSPVLSPCSSAGVHANGTNTDDHAKHKSNVRFMSSMGSRRIFARNGASGTVASVHQFQLEDTATTMEADDDAMQSTAQDMEAAVHVILQEIGEDPERPVSSLVCRLLSSVCCLLAFITTVQLLIGAGVSFPLPHSRKCLPQ